MDLREVFKVYLNQNGLTAAYAARNIGVSSTSLCRWMKKERELPTETLVEIKHFMSGDFLKSVEGIIDGVDEFETEE